MKLTVNYEFSIFPYFRDTVLFKRYGGQFEFAPNAVNVLVGPNGSGKSTLLSVLSHLSFCEDYCQTRASARYLAPELWSGSSSYCEWRKEQYMAGASLSLGFCPALSFKPHRIPGNESCVTTSMMKGFFEEAKAYGRLTKNKSTGQSVSAQLGHILDYLKDEPDLDLLSTSPFWVDSRTEKVLEDSPYQRASIDSRRLILKKYTSGASGHQLVLLDEPDQSLDMLASAQLWETLGSLSLKRTTVIVASHSPFCLRRPFNTIECEQGYLDRVRPISSPI